jgi:hypothetical protein
MKSAMGNSVVLQAPGGTEYLVIAAQIDPDEPSAVASCNDLANFASHRVSSMLATEAHNWRTHTASNYGY